MKIIILGAGQVGSTVAQSLAGEANDITVVDQRPELLKALAQRAKLRTVVGNASHPDVLLRAGIEDADLMLAVTNSDEINMVACQIAHSIFHTPTRLARIRASDYLNHPALFGRDAVPIDFIISPEKLVTQFFGNLIENPGTLQILDFAGGKAQLVVVRADEDGALVGHELRAMPELLPWANTRVVAVFRGGRAVLPDGDTVIEPGDEVFFVAARDHIATVASAFRVSDRPNGKVMIAGGGNIGRQLAEMLEQDLQVKLIERDRRRGRLLAESLHQTLILHGDAADEGLLQEENVDSVDMFCAVTDDDEANILCAMLAKRLGARKVMALINRASYVDLAQSGAVDIAVSPQQVTIGALLAHVRRGDVVAVHSLRRGAAEAIEAVAHGDRRTSRVVGRTVEALGLPTGTVVGALVRGEEVLFPHGESVIEPEDHVIIFVADKSHIATVEKLFQVGITYL